MDALQSVQGGVKQSRVFYFDVLRAAACLAVIVIHVSAQYWYDTDVSTFSWQIYNICDSAVRWGVPIFVMLSGALFLDPDREYPVKCMYGRYIFRMVTAFLFWSAVYALYAFLQTKDAGQFAALLLTGHHHMWFIWMIVGLYMIVPVLRQISRDQRILEYYLLLCVVLAFLLPTLDHMICLLGIPITKDHIFYEGVRRACESSKLYFVLGYTGYFLLGRWLHTAVLSKRQEYGIYILGLLSVAATAWVTSSASRITGVPEISFYLELSAQALLQSAAVFTLGKCRLSKWKPGPFMKKAIQKVSGASFGIYLSHLFFLEYMHQKRYTCVFLEKGPVVYMVCTTVILFVLSYCVTAVLKKVPVLNRYVV